MIEVRDIAYAYGDDPALSGVSLSVERGETFALMGANGAGKTTLLKLLAGLYEPDAGTVETGGVVGFAPEDPRAALFAETVEEEVAFFPRNRGLDAEENAERAMERMDVVRFRERGPLTLSAGEQRRVAVASVLAGDPAVVALDEPTAGLDRAGERTLARLLPGLDATVVLSTHASDFAYEVADRVAVLADGELLRVGEPRSTLADEDLLSAASIRVPGAVAWARRRGLDRPPGSFEEAVEMARGGR